MGRLTVVSTLGIDLGRNPFGEFQEGLVNPHERISVRFGRFFWPLVLSLSTLSFSLRMRFPHGYLPQAKSSKSIPFYYVTKNSDQELLTSPIHPICGRNRSCIDLEHALDRSRAGPEQQTSSWLCGHRRSGQRTRRLYPWQTRQIWTAVRCVCRG